MHALRNALVPTVTLAGVQFPALVGAAFVVEEVFAIHGMGWETLRAIEARDAAWITAVTLLCALVTLACAVGALEERGRVCYVIFALGVVGLDLFERVE